MSFNQPWHVKRGMDRPAGEIRRSTCLRSIGLLREESRPDLLQLGDDLCTVGRCFYRSTGCPASHEEEPRIKCTVAPKANQTMNVLEVESMAADREFMISRHIRWVLNIDGAVLLDTRSGSMFSVNATGGLMWKYIVEGYRREDIVRTVSGEYGVEREQVVVDLDIFLADLEGKHLLDRVSSKEVSERTANGVPQP